MYPRVADRPKSLREFSVELRETVVAAASIVATERRRRTLVTDEPAEIISWFSRTFDRRWEPIPPTRRERPIPACRPRTRARGAGRPAGTRRRSTRSSAASRGDPDLPPGPRAASRLRGRP